VAKQQRPPTGTLWSLPPDGAEPDPAYRAVLDWVWSYSARPRSPEEVAAQRAVKLERMRALLSALGHPERAFPSLLVAGTKGKGSTVAMLSACLRAAGWRTGRYTSPHLVNWRERTTIDDEPIGTDQAIALAEPIRQAIGDLAPAMGPPTTFEVGTLFAFLHFAQQNIDVGVVEVGTGGRLDATNLLEPEVSAITPISYDHTQTLGDSLSKIAWHKAGILRAGRPGILAPQPDEARAVVEREAAAIGAPLEEVGKHWWWTTTGDGIRVESTNTDFPPLETRVGLLGDHQRDNATTSVAALHAVSSRFKVSPEALRAGLAHVEWPGRLQVLAKQPLLVLDGAHNAASATVLHNAIEANFEFNRLLVVVGLSAGKDAVGVLEALVPTAYSVYLTRSQHERAALPSELEPLVSSSAPRARVSVAQDLPSALENALAEAASDDLVLVTGSVFLVGEALAWWRRSSR
jgi:dihydrofolate synthase/folylpolyglutamate synthase